MTDPGEVIRPAAPEEAGAIAALIRESFADVAVRFGLNRDNCPKHPSNCETDWVGAAMAKGVDYWVMEANGRCIGCVALEKAGPDVCYLERLAVPPGLRRRGRGRWLVETALARATEIGADRVEIGIIAAQDDLQTWYENIGFEFIRTQTFPHLPFEVAFMKRPLKTHAG